MPVLNTYNSSNQSPKAKLMLSPNIYSFCHGMAHVGNDIDSEGNNPNFIAVKTFNSLYINSQVYKLDNRKMYSLTSLKLNYYFTRLIGTI